TAARITHIAGLMDALPESWSRALESARRQTLSVFFSGQPGARWPRRSGRLRTGDAFGGGGIDARLLDQRPAIDIGRAAEIDERQQRERRRHGAEADRRTHARRD